jgi:hypothetical protein
MKEAALAGKSLPGNRSELYVCFVARLLLRDIGERGLETWFQNHVKRHAATRFRFSCDGCPVLTLISGVSEF